MKTVFWWMAILFLPPTHVLAVNFSLSVRPILSEHCYQCHGPDEKERTAELRLDTEAGVAAAFAGGSLQESEAWRRINSTDPAEQMPPPEFRKPLTAAQLGLLKQWMVEGAGWSQHWAFSKPVRQSPPRVEGAIHPIDRFVLTKLRQEGLEPSAAAPCETLVRRLKLDLLGLPPTVAELDAFVGDPSPDAFDPWIDSLLASPHFGERMAIEWLDGARYADTNGYQNDFKRSMWPWRDWVIGAFNDNMPYDQFVIEQLAGDLLPSPSLEQRIATGFNRNHRTVTEFGSIDAEWLVENVVDRIETTSTVFLGLTMGCARCHDHKYDPISQTEFYQFFSFFHNVKEQGVYPETRGNVAPLQPVLPTAELQRLDALRERRAKAKSTFDAMQSELPAKADAWQVADLLPGGSPQDPTSNVRLELAGDAAAMLADGRQFLPVEQSGTFAWVDGVFGTAAKFTGLHTLSYGQAIAPDRLDRWTFTFWVKPSKMGSIVDKIDLGKFSRGFDIYWKQNGQLEVHLIHSWPQDAIKVITQAEKSVPEGRWSHVAIRYDGSSKAAGIQLLVNGRPVALQVEADQLQGSIAVEQPIRIGLKSRGFTFFGLLSDFRFFDQSLADASISTIASEGLARIFATGSDDANETLPEQRHNLYADFSNSPFAVQFRAAAGLLRSTQQALGELEQSTATVMVMEELATPRETFVLLRGEYDKPDKSQPVTSDVPRFLGTLPAELKKDRLALARWMVAADNPLTARVRVNRIWQILFGVGLVKTSENFGVQAEVPSHPELLDWLATEFVRSGWDTKGLLKLIVTSQTYRQSSVITSELAVKDPENRLLARGPRIRLPAELLRDNVLAVSGLLTTKVGGESIKPYQPDKLWDELAGGAGEGKYVQSHGDDLYRRSLYIYRKRTVPHPTTSTFDAPSFEICQVARARTNTPLQALALLNDVTYVEAARKLGERMLTQGGETDRSRLAYGFRLVTGRIPTDGELETLQRSCARKRDRFANDRNAAIAYLSHGEAKTTIAAPVEQRAAYAAVASILLNLDETMTKE